MNLREQWRASAENALLSGKAERLSWQTTQGSAGYE